MPIAFIAVGALFLIAAVRGTINDYDNGKPGLLTLLKSDFVSTSAQGNFLIWMVSLWIIGALGYIPGFKPIANALLFLVVLVLFLSNSKAAGPGGIFAKFNAALTQSQGPTGQLGTVDTSFSQGVENGSLVPMTPIAPIQPPSTSLGFLPGGTIQVPGFQGVGTIG